MSSNSEAEEGGAESSGSGGMASWGGLSSWAEKAVKQASEQASGAYSKLQQGAVDLEAGDTGSKLTSWVVGAAENAKKNLAQAAEKANTAEWGEQAKAWQNGLSSSVSGTIGRVSDYADKAGAGLSEHAKLAHQKTSQLAGSGKDALKRAGTGITDGLGGMGALAMSPMKLMQSGAIFFVGMMLITLSLSFLPLLPIAPSKFSLLFSLGSMAILGSVAWLKGPPAFASAMLQRDKLPFSIAYLVGLLGTLWATIIYKSYIFTGIFVTIQVVGLLYFIASYVPGGKVVLNFFGRLSGRIARMVMPGRK